MRLGSVAIVMAGVAAAACATAAALLPSGPTEVAGPLITTEPQSTYPTGYVCSRAGTDLVTRLADLPPTVRALLPTVDATPPGIRKEMADPGQRWNVGDAVMYPGLPFRRLICGYSDGGGFVVEWEFGGIVHGSRRTAFRGNGTGYVLQ